MQHFFTPDEREMLIRYCTRFTQNRFLAEDLTQQALLESWLKSDHMYNPEVRSSWLIGIARNVCLRWVRMQRQEKARLTRISDLSFEMEAFQDDVDPQEEFERHELAQLVEKAAALLPFQTRTALVQYYLEAVPQAEVAAHLGITVGAVEARLNRGKRELRRLFTHEMREEAESLGLITSALADWQHTQIWCPVCGQRQLLVRLPHPPGTIAFRCPGCDGDPERIGWAYPLSNARFVQHLAGLRQPKAILRRFTSWSHDYYYTAALHYGIVTCAQCGQERRLQLVLPAHLSVSESESASRAGLSGECPFCGWQDFCSPGGLLQGLPVVQRFWQAHPRMRMIFREPIEETAGTSAMVATFESLTGSAQLDVLFAQETLTLIEFHTNALLDGGEAC